MTVKELITKLEQEPQDMQVLIFTVCEGGYSTVLDGRIPFAHSKIKPDSHDEAYGIHFSTPDNPKEESFLLLLGHEDPSDSSYYQNWLQRSQEWDKPPKEKRRYSDYPPY